MKKYFSMIAIAIASVMAFSSCGKDETTEIVDPLAGKHVVEAVIHAEVTGAFTKALAIEVEYQDFDGKTYKKVVNANYDGKDATFDTTISTTVSDNEQVATIHFKGILCDVENYKSEVSPWGMVCSAVAKVDGNERSFYCSSATTEPNKPILENMLGTSMNVDYAYKNGVQKLEDRLGNQKLIITVGKKETLLTNWHL